MTTKFLLIFVLLIMNNSSYANDGLDVQGHRGARAVLPENTLPAFEYALEIGVDTLELDTGVSKDDVVVVYHDQKINNALCQYTDGSRIVNEPLIHSLSLTEIKQIDCGSKSNPRFPNQSVKPGAQIPTLAEVFELVANSKHPSAKNIRFNIETKSNSDKPNAQPQPSLFVSLILKLVKEYQLESRVTIQSFDHRTLHEAQIQAPQIERAALFSDRQRDWVAAAKKADAQVVSPNFKKIRREDVNALQAAGFKVIPWTANQRKDW